MSSSCTASWHRWYIAATMRKFLLIQSVFIYFCSGLSFSNPCFYPLSVDWATQHLQKQHKFTERQTRRWTERRTTDGHTDRQGENKCFYKIERQINSIRYHHNAAKTLIVLLNQSIAVYKNTDYHESNRAKNCLRRRNWPSRSAVVGWDFWLFRSWVIELAVLFGPKT